MARWKRVLALGTLKRVLMSSAPDDWPAKVTREELPPRAGIFAEIKAVLWKHARQSLSR